jgi:hypothetical protein
MLTLHCILSVVVIGVEVSISGIPPLYRSMHADDIASPYTAGRAHNIMTYSTATKMALANHHTFDFATMSTLQQPIIIHH